VGGRKGLALGSILVAAGLSVGVAIGRSSKHAEPDDELPLASTRFTEELTDTTPAAAELGGEIIAPPPAPPLPRAPARPVPAPTARPAPGAAGAAAPTIPDAGAPPAEEPPAPQPPDAAAAAPMPEPDPYLVRLGRVFDDNQITSSSWDEDDVSEYSVVPDREVTSSSFDDQDKIDEHPTGR
jgi:hypothetical protein